MIKIDIDMPKNCDLCPFCCCEFANCRLSYEYISQFGKVKTDFEKRPANCPLIDADETKEIIWHPVTYRPMTPDEVEHYEREFGAFADDEKIMFDCEMPEDGQEILITTKWGVDTDICSCEYMDGYGLENRGDWDGVTAWAPMPDPYKEAGNDDKGMVK